MEGSFGFVDNKPVRLSWFPNRGGWSWWQASRVVQDFRLNGSSIEIIDEFPFFTYLLADIHPHLLGMPFVLLAISQALNAFRGGWEGSMRFFRWNIAIDWKSALLAVVTLGGIAFLNTWDFPFYLLLIVAALVWRQSSMEGWNKKRVFQVISYSLIGGILSILAYLPFYLSFSSQAGGLLPSLAFFTRGSYFWIMFGPLLVPIMAWLIYQQIKSRRLPSLYSWLLTAASVALLFLAGWGLGWIAGRIENLSGLLNDLQGALDNTDLLLRAILERLKSPGTFITMFVMVLLAFDYFIRKVRIENAQPIDESPELITGFKLETRGFVLMLVLLGALLVIVPEFVYLRDQFGTRMNTIFKFYFQAWILWSLAGAYFIAKFLLDADPGKIRPFATIIILIGLIVFSFSIVQQTETLQPEFGSNWLDFLVLAIPVLFLAWLGTAIVRKNAKLALAILSLASLSAGLVFPIIELWNKTEGFQPRDGYSLDVNKIFTRITQTKYEPLPGLPRLRQA